MNRRELMLLVGGAVIASRSLRAQQPEIPRVGILSPAENEATLNFEAFRRGLRELGYVEGRNIILEYRFAHGEYSALARLAEELANLPVDVIVADTTASTRAAASAARTIPIVMAAGLDPVALGLAHSLARPGGNVTGFTLMSHELSGKRVDLMRTAFPDATAMMVLLNPSNAISAEANLRDTEEAARALGLTLTHVEAATAEALHALGSEGLGGGGGPILVLPDAMFWNHRQEILALAAAARLPALYPEREYADDGGLMAYGPSVPNNFRHAAGYVDRILRGAKPGDLPIQEPVRFDFVVNLRTAKAIGLTIPPKMLDLADEVIE